MLRFGIRLYPLSGEDSDKLAALHAMARTDFLASDWYRLPQRCILVPPGPHASLVGAALVGQLRSAPYREEAFDQVWKRLPDFNIVSDDGARAIKLPSPKPLLRVETVLWEFPDGRLLFPPQDGRDTLFMEI